MVYFGNTKGFKKKQNNVFVINILIIVNVHAGEGSGTI